MKRINTILWSNKEPEDKNILWLNKRKLYLWDNGWVAISGSGGSDADLSNYLTKQKADKLYQPKGNYATKSELSSVEEWIEGIDDILGQYIPTIEQVPFKQEKLISGKNIKTINGHSLLGEGDVTIVGGSGNIDIDLSSYLTKDLAAELYQLKGNYAPLSALEELQNTTEFLDIELGNVINGLRTKQDNLTAGQNINIENNVISCTLDTNLYVVVNELPLVGVHNKIYLVKDDRAIGSNVYTEYIYNNGWETLGEYNTSINLDEYATNEDVSNAINNLKGGELVFNNIKELEDCVLEESEKLATLFNEVESGVFTLELTSDSGFLSKNIVNKLRNNKLINLLYKNLNYSLTTRSFNNSNSGILIFTSTDISTTYTYYLSINTTDYSYTGTNSIFKVPDEVYIWEQNDKESNTISTQDWTQLANAKQIIIKQGYSHYIPTTISKVAPGDSIKHIICIHDSSPSSSSNITRKWMFSFPELTVQYQESPTSVNLEPYALKENIPTKISQLENDVEYVKINELPDAETYVLKFTISDGVNTGAYNAADYANLLAAIKAGKLIIISGGATRVTADSQAIATGDAYVVIRYSTPRISEDNKSVTISFYELKFSATEYTSKAIHKTIG